jgi:N-acyl-D-amino-acid deacylase
LAVLLLCLPPGAFAQSYDLVLTNGRVVDGTGNPAFPADVAIRDGRIVAIGRVTNTAAAKTIDVTGKLIVPGFIDLHSHAARGLASDDAKRRSAPNLVTQGITTVVLNSDGGGPWPLEEQRTTLTRLGIGPNAILMVGHNTIRRRALGDDYKRTATPEEIRSMKQMMREGMGHGAFGMTAGLEYVPGIWSDTEELVALVEQIAPFGGVYIVHQRSESTEPDWYLASQDPKGLPTMLDAVEETIEIGERTGARVVSSHLKAMGAHYWGSIAAAIRLIGRARSRGVDVWADQYPYHSTGGDGSMVLIPDWAVGESVLDEDATPGKKDYASALRQTMDDQEKARKVRRDMTHEMSRRGGPENIVVFDHPDSTFVGKTLDELAQARGIDPIRMALELQYEGYRDRIGGARLRGFSVWEEDLKTLMKQPWLATSTDAGIALTSDRPVHARFYGSYPRKLRRYALDEGVLSLEDAVRSSTSLPAQILGLRDRGMVREGFHADLVVLDLEKVADKATFFEPHQYSEGVDYVFVNGQALVEAGRSTGQLAGKVLLPARSAGSN